MNMAMKIARVVDSNWPAQKKATRAKKPTHQKPSVRVTKKLVEEICNSSLRQHIDDELAIIRDEMESAAEGLMNRVMMDRKRNEELIESRTSSSPRSKEAQEFRLEVLQFVADSTKKLGAIRAEWEKLRAESASNHATRMKVYQDHEERINAIINQVAQLTRSNLDHDHRLHQIEIAASEPIAGCQNPDRIVAGMDISLALHRMHLVRDCAMRWANQPMRSAAEDAIRALGGTIE